MQLSDWLLGVKLFSVLKKTSIIYSSCSNSNWLQWQTPWSFVLLSWIDVNDFITFNSSSKAIKKGMSSLALPYIEIVFSTFFSTIKTFTCILINQPNGNAHDTVWSM